MSSESKIATLSARLVDPNPRSNSRGTEDDDDEALFAELEEEIENDSNALMREQGLVELRREMERLKEMRENQHGKYTEIKDEKEVIRVSAKAPLCVVHFYHSKFQRCEIMDKHLSKLAPKYFSTRFIRVFVENVPWLVEKLAIKVLPCVICFADGVTRDRIIGFEELGNHDAFETATLELRLSVCGVIEKNSGTRGSQQAYTARSTIRGLHGNDDGGDIFDLDD